MTGKKKQKQTYGLKKGKVYKVRNYCLIKLFGGGGLHFHVQPGSGSKWRIGTIARNMIDRQTDKWTNGSTDNFKIYMRIGFQKEKNLLFFWEK